MQIIEMCNYVPNKAYLDLKGLMSKQYKLISLLPVKLLRYWTIQKNNAEIMLIRHM